MNSETSRKCVVLSADMEGLSVAAAYLRAGRLVAFPTETVYGLGASALNAAAIEAIFEVKGRPLSDPLIVHVCNADMARKLCVLSEGENRIFSALVESFWPGPLTLVANAADIVPRIVTGGGDTVGLRHPRHSIAQILIEKCGLPLAAPSANVFGHVSPTEASHVVSDLGQWPIWVLDGGSCTVGIESTVAKIVSESEVLILRRGAVSAEAIRVTLERLNVKARVSVFERVVRNNSEMLSSPGQSLIHYAPAVPAFLIGQDNFENNLGPKIALDKCALVDIGAQLSSYSSECLAYVDLSTSGNLHEACERIFSVLRVLEKQAGVEAILLPDLSNEDEEMALALADRLNRAAAFKRAKIINSFVQAYA
jgi:tRNA threonylcarbamoyl adenosine modification protein (Sua5/YciO/YrdC/YwlC family)